ncbi:MAG: DUF222 domain-containing protein [Acidimicrobiia bacterium]
MSADIECRLRHVVQQLQNIGDPACRVGLLQKVVNLAQELVRVEVRRARADAGFAAEGFTSVSAWLACHTGLGGGGARAVVRQAAELEHMPHSMAAAGRGRLHEQQVRLLVACRRADPQRYDGETDRAFCVLPIAELVVAARAWQAAAADRRHDPTKPSGTPSERASVHLAQLLDGRWRLDGTLNPHDGALLNQALDQLIGRQLQARRDGDPSAEALSIGSMRAQGLVDLAAQALREQPGNRSRNGRYRINLVVRPGQQGLVPDGPFPLEAWCDSTWVRAVMGAAGEVLDIGRATRDWPEAIWNAIVQRDRTCRFPHCDRPAHWCDVHHCTHWEHGGTTCLTNGVLLCRRHHVFLHSNHWSVTLDERQRPVFRQPDGRPFRPRPCAPSADPDPT